MKSHFFESPRQDLIAGAVVFLVALPLCLGIAVACGVPPVAGLIAGVVGGIVVPLISRSPLSVTGPAAGLTSVVLLEVEQLGSLQTFLAAVVIAGGLQVVLGLVRAGRFSALVPSAAIKGMLAAIGITILLKQLPAAAGVVGAIKDIPALWHKGPALVAALSLAILLIWPRTPLKRLTFLPAALVVVVLSTVLASLMEGTAWALLPMHHVVVPDGGPSGLWAALTHPRLESFGRGDVWVAGLTIAIVASIETLLSVQAVDRLDPLQRRSPPDRELVAQGFGNIVSGFVGGLPVTAVIVRSGANVAAGGRDRLSTMFHGALLFVAVASAASLLNQIPLACLAAVLIVVGLNLAKPSLFIQQAKLGLDQFLPFLATIVAVLATDLLKGVVFGVVLSLGFTLHQNSVGAITKTVDDDGTIRLTFRRDATFLTKPQMMRELEAVPDNGAVIVDTTGEYVDLDAREALAQFVHDAEERGIRAEVLGVTLAAHVAAGH